MAVCRELTKLHEEVRRGSAAELAAHYRETPARGEVVLVVGAAAAARAPLKDALAAVRELIDAGAKPRPAAAAVAKLTGLRANELYREITRGLGLHDKCRIVYHGAVEQTSTRLNVTLDSEHAAKLSMLAERTHVQEGTLARSLLSSALDDADPDPRTITALLDGIPGAFEEAQLGLQQGREGKTVPLDEL